MYQNCSVEEQMSESEGFWASKSTFDTQKVQHKGLKEQSDAVEIRESREC